MKYILATKQNIIDYRNELVETGWNPREEDAEQVVDAPMLPDSKVCFECGKNINGELVSQQDLALLKKLLESKNQIKQILKEHGKEYKELSSKITIGQKRRILQETKYWSIENVRGAVQRLCSVGFQIQEISSEPTNIIEAEKINAKIFYSSVDNYFREDRPSVWNRTSKRTTTIRLRNERYDTILVQFPMLINEARKTVITYFSSSDNCSNILDKIVSILSELDIHPYGGKEVIFQYTMKTKDDIFTALKELGDQGYHF